MQISVQFEQKQMIKNAHCIENAKGILTIWDDDCILFLTSEYVFTNNKEEGDFHENNYDFFKYNRKGENICK